MVGFSGLPSAGDEFLVMASEKDAKTLGEERLAIDRSKKMAKPQRATLESLFQRTGDGPKILRLIVKTDVQGSLEAITTSLEQIDSKKAEVEFVHTAVGPISESDVQLASASNAVVIGFNTKLENVALVAAKREGVEVKLYSIIYELIDQVKESMAGLLDPESRETVIGHAEVKQVFELTKGNVAGCIVTDGRIARTARARVLAQASVGVRRRAGDAAPVPGRREGSPLRVGVRHQARRLQRLSGRGHHRVLHAGEDRAEALTSCP